MATTNHERVGKMMDLLKAGLGPYVEREFTSTYGNRANTQVAMIIGDDRINAKRPLSDMDASALLKIMWDSWNDVFRKTLGQTERTLVSELRDVRNRWAHQESFSGDDAYRALDSAARLLTAVSAPQTEEIEKARMELLRVRFDEQVRSEKRKTAATTIESAVTGNLKPWREVVTPHKDVASGRYQQAEFAADLWQVHLGEGSAEYKDPAEFFRRTHLTESLKRLLVGAVERMTGKGGDPVVQLQTNFGGGKTHSMLALYHLFSGTPVASLAGVEELMRDAGVKNLPQVKRVVLVGNKISPGNPVTKKDGTVVRTLWGELAYQLGGKKAFAKIAADDEKATSPGDTLRTLFNEYGPCLVLIDEWVAYARQLHDSSDLPAGGFETQFSFAQALTESAKLAKNCLLVISLPASDTAGIGSPHTGTEDVEVGGVRGREALDRLRNVVGRLESSWRPATAEEGFEIVRRRLFEPMSTPAQYKDRDVVAREFAELYRNKEHEFPPDCREAEYEARIKAAYPIHPEIFDRLYTDWSTLVKFQRTRGVLRLMAAVIHSLWEKGDRNALIQPGNIPIEDQRVQFELTRYLSDNWAPVLEKDVDALPLRNDNEVPNLGKYAASRRVARTIYLGSAPTATAAHRGIEDRRVHLGSVMPGEPLGVFDDALRRLASSATYLYEEGKRYWYSTQQTLTKTADERAEQLKRDQGRVLGEIEDRLRDAAKEEGDFKRRVHVVADAADIVADDLSTKLVILGASYAFSKEASNAASAAAKTILETRGTAPRIYRNTLVFLAPDKSRLQDLDDAMRRMMAWQSILNDRIQLELPPYQVKQAETQFATAEATVKARIPETYRWLLVPVQKRPEDPVSFETLELKTAEPLAIRAGNRLRKEELMLTSLGPTRLRMELDRIPLWDGDHVEVRQLVDHFARYVYLPRLADPQVLLTSIREGVALLSWPHDSFAIADSYDVTGDRYRGLRGGRNIDLPDAESSALLVKPDVAQKQLEQDSAAQARPTADSAMSSAGADQKPGETSAPSPAAPPRLTRYHGTVTLDPTRVGRDAGRIAEEVIAHLEALKGANVEVTLEISAHVPEGVSDTIVRIVTENSRALKFTSHGFEKE